MTDYDIRWDAENPRWTYLKVTDRDDPEWSGWSLNPEEGDTPENLERDAAAFIAAAAWLRDEQRRTPGTDAHAAWVELERAAGRAHAKSKRHWTRQTWTDKSTPLPYRPLTYLEPGVQYTLTACDTNQTPA